MSHQVRGMSKAEEHLLVEWAAAEGWNPGLHDADSFWNLDPEGFLGIELDGMFVGGGAVIRHNQSFGFMGLFIVDPKYRGRQLGTKLWMARRDHLLSRLGSDATIGLDGVDAMVPFYARGGFREFTRHRRFELLPADDSAEPEHGIVDLNDVEFSDVLALDRKCFPGDRQQFLSSWLNQPGGVALGTVDDRGAVRGRLQCGRRTVSGFCAPGEPAGRVPGCSRQQPGRPETVSKVPDE